jgi:hypothetical protein
MKNKEISVLTFSSVSLTHAQFLLKNYSYIVKVHNIYIQSATIMVFHDFYRLILKF